MTDRLQSYLCTNCDLDFACYTDHPLACPNCGYRYGGGDDDDKP